MLLNLSNHPSVNWSKEQREAAEKQFGGVVDLPFPQIPSGATTAEVKALAQTYLEKIPPSVSAVHLMGELTFVVALVRLLQKNKIKVVASAAERQVLEEKDGIKTAKFQFVQFREYPK
jgi:hypothetical protein